MVQNTKGGRPRYEPTEEDRETVAILAGGGESHEAIALALGVARQTLETYFPAELSVGAYKKRAAVMRKLYDVAMNGSIPAIRQYTSVAPQSAPPPDEPADKAEPLGKKAQADLDAQTAHMGTDWENILAPRKVLQ